MLPLSNNIINTNTISNINNIDTVPAVSFVSPVTFITSDPIKEYHVNFSLINGETVFWHGETRVGYVELNDYKFISSSPNLNWKYISIPTNTELTSVMQTAFFSTKQLICDVEVIQDVNFQLTSKSTLSLHFICF